MLLTVTDARDVLAWSISLWDTGEIYMLVIDEIARRKNSKTRWLPRRIKLSRPCRQKILVELDHPRDYVLIDPALAVNLNDSWWY